MRPRWIPLARRLAAKRRGLPYVRRLEPLAIVDDPREIRDSRLVILGQRAEAAKPPSTVAQRPSKVRNTRLVLVARTFRELPRGRRPSSRFVLRRSTTGEYSESRAVGYAAALT